MMIARGKKAIRPFPGLWAAKRITDATPLNIIAASAPGKFPNYCRITRRKEILPQFFRRQDQSLSALVCATSWNERTAAPLRMTRFQTRLKLRREPREVPKRDSLTDCLHDVKEKVKVVVGVQDGAQDFVGSEQMTKVRARIAAAN